MNGCGRQFCRCGAELIHRDDRAWYEAASTLLAIIRRCGPVNLTVGDIDAYVSKWFRDRVLLRLVEHKQPRQALKQEQRAVLWCLDELIRHYIDNPPPNPRLRLDPRSGVYIMRGHVEGGQHGRRETQFVGPQTVMRLITGAKETLADQEAVFAWLEGISGGRRRVHGRAA